MWPHRDIESLCTTITSGGTPKRSDPSNYDPGTIPWIKTAELQDAEIVSSKERISQFGLAHSSAKILPPSTVLMAMYGATVGKLGITQFEMTCNQASCAMITDPARTSARWLFYSLLRNRADLVGLANGAAQQNLSARTIRHFQIPVPPLSEQKAIAEVLGALDDKIAANRKLGPTADALVRALYDALPDEGGKNLVDICDNVRSQVTPEGSGVAYVGLESIPRRQMWLQQFGDSSAVNSAKNEFKAGDVLFGKLRPYFHKVTSAPLSGICSTDILVLRPRNNDLAGLVLAAASSDSVIAETSAASEGTRMPRTKWGILGRCQIRWPGEECATRFSQTVVTIRDAIEASARESQTLAELRDTLLPALMDGTIRVKDAETHVEEVL